MGRNKTSGKKKKLIKLGKSRSAPRWADIKKFSLKRARSRRIRVNEVKHWRKSKLKV